MSRFVPAGTSDTSAQKDEEWLKAQEDLEESKLRKEEEGRQEGGKTLFEVLQANKAAKQEAFEESIKLKNQFRTLHEDEVDFLDQVLESTRARDASVQKETLEQLENFRMQRENAEKAARQSEGEDGDDVRWAPTTGGGRKRKKGKDKATVPGIKYRKSSSTRDEISYEKQESFKEAVKSDLRGDKESKQVKLEGPRVGQGEGRELGSTSTPSLGLAAYSDEE